jgi:uncharacterized membrane protein HdeD (DUF308 family)
MAQESETTLVGIGGSWGWALIYGIVTGLLGLAIAVWPKQALGIFVLLFGVQLLILGIFQIVGAFAWNEPSGRVLRVVLGILAIILGVLVMRHLFGTVVVLGLILGVFWFVHGIVELVAAAFHQGVSERGWRIFAGILSAVAGLIVIGFPALTLGALTWILGIWLILLGLIEILIAFKVKKLEAT